MIARRSAEADRFERIVQRDELGKVHVRRVAGAAAVVV